jgi:hypothetical protein
MTKWEYIELYMADNEFRIISAQGEFFTDDEYTAIDPKGHRDGSTWKSGMPKTLFLLRVLGKLGVKGWEAVGNINSGYYTDVYLLLKRPLTE